MNRTHQQSLRGSPLDRPTLGIGMLERAAREYGKLHGFKGNHGGWISDGTQSITQGWFSFGTMRFGRIADYYTARLTAFNSFADLLNTHESYCPTIPPTTWREVFLANAFDRAMYDRKSPRRAWRGTTPGGN